MGFPLIGKTAKGEFDKRCANKITYYNMDNLKDRFDFDAILDLNSCTIQFSSELSKKLSASNKFFVDNRTNTVFVIGSMDMVAETLTKNDGKVDTYNTFKATIQRKKLALQD